MPHALANMKIFEQAAFLCKSWPSIRAAAERAQRGDIFDVHHRSAKVERRSSMQRRRSQR
jgi:hypothetical protein